MTRHHQRPAVRISTLALVILLAAGAGGGAQTLMGGKTEHKPIDFSDRIVKFPSLDGVNIQADYYPVKVSSKKKTPIAILIHMYPADRSSWKPLVPALRESGVAVLAYDIRGTGGSTKPKERNLVKGYKDQDPAHFGLAWMDVEGAKAWLAGQDNIDISRCVLIGASIGCSIALDDAARTQSAAGVVCLSPGTNYFGLDSIEHIKACSSIPVLLISLKGEFEAVAQLVEASGGKAKSKQYPGGNENHGTNLFKADFGSKVTNKIMKFVRKSLGIKKKKNKDDEKKSDKKDKKKKKSKKAT
jgi:pimeloyl-ACP methyl ester carboxylesterase